jgi:hypothetical protein
MTLSSTVTVITATAWLAVLRIWELPRCAGGGAFTHLTGSSSPAMAGFGRRGVIGAEVIRAG